MPATPSPIATSGSSLTILRSQLRLASSTSRLQCVMLRLRSEIVNIGETLCIETRREWRRWLADHCQVKSEIWLVFSKKTSGKPSMPYDDAVQEAICYGWIDGQVKSIDEDKFARRFSPRREGSNWSKYNKARALKMLREGKMTEAGAALLPSEVLRNRDRQS